MKKVIIVIIILVVLIFVLLGVTPHFLKPTAQTTNQVIAVSFDDLLNKYVSDGRINYLEWKKNDFVVFEQYIKSLEDVTLDNLNQDEKKAFWINTYNALTIYAVLKRIPSNKLLSKVFSVQMVFGFFDKIKYTVANESLTLNEIENSKLREVFSDPRIHFAIVCASRSCPKIQNTVFSHLNLDKRLDEATRDFMQDSTRNRIDRNKNTIYLSQIFKWYSQDFTDDSGLVMSYFRKYLSQSDSQYLSENNLGIKYLNYDWLVNIKR